MRKAIKYAGLSLAILIAAYLGLGMYVVAQQGMVELLVCAQTGGFKLPFSRQVCRNYMYAFRGTPQDIAELEDSIGASWVLHGEVHRAEREQLLRFLIAHGLRVDSLNMHKLRPLHGEVLDNDPGDIAMLLRNGANPHLRDAMYYKTPLELATWLQRERQPGIDRSAVIDILSKATNG